jgi:hypothetical protein
MEAVVRVMEDEACATRWAREDDAAMGRWIDRVREFAPVAQTLPGPVAAAPELAG